MKEEDKRRRESVRILMLRILIGILVLALLSGFLSVLLA